MVAARGMQPRNASTHHAIHVKLYRILEVLTKTCHFLSRRFQEVPGSRATRKAAGCACGALLIALPISTMCTTFCPTCGNLLMVETTATHRLRFSCRTCPYVYNIDKTVQSRPGLLRPPAPFGPAE